MKSTPESRTLQRAAEASGGVVELAKILDVSVGELSHWLDGTVPPPVAIYKKALDLLARAK
jgi:hypothetical protein